MKAMEKWKQALNEKEIKFFEEENGKVIVFGAKGTNGVYTFNIFCAEISPEDINVGDIITIISTNEFVVIPEDVLDSAYRAANKLNSMTKTANIFIGNNRRICLKSTARVKTEDFSNEDILFLLEEHTFWSDFLMPKVLKDAYSNQEDESEMSHKEIIRNFKKEARAILN